MQRDLLKQLEDWTTDVHRKPLILRGARQVGKSWLVRELGKKFKNFVEINFERDVQIKDFFEGDLNPSILISNLSNYLGQKIVAGESLLFFDEIQLAPKAITALRYFYEEMPELHLISAGSLLEFQLRKMSIPVGRVSFLQVYPLSFGEYLTASGKKDIRAKLIKQGLTSLPKPLHNQLLADVRNYTLIGGMPEVVNKYIVTKDLELCMQIQDDLIQTYKSDFHKYVKAYQIKYIEQVFQSVPFQLGKKFKYSNIDKQIKTKNLAEALDMLELAGIVYKVYHSNANGIPLGAEIKTTKFKALFFDIGLAQRMMKLDYKNMLLNLDIEQINNGEIAELFTGLELIAYQNPRLKAELYYWHREAKSSNAEVDFITTVDNKIIPIEVKRGSTGQMKSMHIFLTQKQHDLGIKISSDNYSLYKQIQAIPFYGIESLVKK